MAAKTEGEVVTQLQDYVALYKIMIDFLEGPMEIQLESIEDEIVTGDSNYITDGQLQALRQFRSYLGNFWSNAIPMLKSVAPTLSELAGSSNPGTEYSSDIAWFHDYLTDNSKAVPTRGFTKSSWSADGSNTGTGRIVQHTADLATLAIDCAHPDSGLRLRCLKSAGRGITEGQEPFELIGSKVNRAWEDDGLSNGLYEPQLGKGFNDLGADQLRVKGYGQDVEAMRAMSGGSPLNLLGTNGGIEAAVSGTANSRFSGMTIISGGTNLSVESTAPLVGSQSLKVDGDFVAYIPLNVNALYPKTALAFGALVKKVISSSTLTGTLTFVLRSGGAKGTAAQGTAHSTISVTVGSLTDNTTTNEDQTLIVPAALGADPRIEITMASYSDGSGTDNSLLIDEIYAARMYQMDMGQFVLPVSGVTPFETDDFFTATVTTAGDEAAAGLTQEFFNRLFGRYVKHSAAGTTFVDPTLAPEIVVRSSVDGSSYSAHTDGGQVDHGTDAAGDVTFYVEFSNTGNYPLALGIPAESGATNCSIASGKNSAPVVVQPNRKYIMPIVVTIAGAGAYDITLTWDTNDSSEATYEVDLIGTGS
jgi:hypothetical protein